MRVIDLAKKANVTSETVRHYTRSGLLHAERDLNNGYQIYNEASLKRMQFIQQSQTLGLSLKQIKSIIEQADSGDSACPMVRFVIKKSPRNKGKNHSIAVPLENNGGGFNDVGKHAEWHSR
ncbi:MAG: MerR family transcriptional regulator [Marinomonas sp.]